MTKRLHIMHQSGKFSISEEAYEAELRKNLRENPDIYSTTENTFHGATFRRVCTSMGYRPVTFSGITEGDIALRLTTCQLRNQGSIPTLARNVGGSHGPLSIEWVKVTWNDINLFHHVQHWVNVAGGAGRVGYHQKQTDAMVTIVRKHAKQGRANLAFYAGDVNDDDQPDGNLRTNWNKVLNQSGMQSIWDEFKVYPATIGAVGRTVDVIGKQKDPCLDGARYKVYAAGASDHRCISAWYEIDVAQIIKRSSRPNDNSSTPTPSDNSGNNADDDIYATGGNIDFSDYRDPEIYRIPQATDDSDTTNG